MTFQMAYTFLGGLGIFFFGMKTLSEGLQAIAGNMIRRVISALTTNRVMAVLVGTFVTTLVQSSSVTTVMVVGFVNAGLMELTQAIGVILGANIGTTITGWIIAIKIGKYGLLFVGLGIFPLLFSKNEKVKACGTVLLALGFVFMGLKFMSGALKPLKDTEGFLNLMQYFTAETYLSVYACIAVGAALTFIVQSSSAMLGVTIALALTGAISFQTAVALVLGENIGTTVTALLASIGANTQAKRAARAHAFFNVLGVVVISTFFWGYIGLVDRIVMGSPSLVGSDGSMVYVAAHIAAAHTLFNVTNVILFLPFIHYLARFVTWLTPATGKKEIPQLKFLPTVPNTAAPSMALGAAEKEIEHLSSVVSKTLGLTRDYLTQSRLDPKVRKKIDHLEEVSDRIQTEVTLFLFKTQEAKLSYEQTSLAYALIRAADELESIADYCSALARYRDRLESSREGLSEAAIADLRGFSDEIITYFETIRENIVSSEWNIEKVLREANEIAKKADTIRDRHRARLEKRDCSPIAGMLFSDMIVGLRKIRGHILNVAEVKSGRYDVTAS